MKNRYAHILCFALFLMIGHLNFAQAFHRYSLSVAITGGSTRAVYSTRDNLELGSSTLRNRECIKGEMDPLVIEFGITNHIGIGFTHGENAYMIDANKFYNYGPADEPGKQLYSHVSYSTFDVYFHPYITRKLDFAIFNSVGSLRVNVWDDLILPGSTAELHPNIDSDLDYHLYYAQGTILRTGIQTRYYFWKRLGIMSMISGFSGFAKPKTATGNNFGSGYSTVLTGYTCEFGLCFRFF
jgi:hypothetical protein